MDNRTEVRDFLMSRRAKLTPQQAGLLPGSNRRVPGLRRTEVAVLAGVSVEYYAKLERGAIAGASSSVLEAVATALRLDETEWAHLLDLARTADGVPAARRPRRRGAKHPTARPSLHWALEAITDGIAFVRDQHQDLLAAPRQDATRTIALCRTWSVNCPPAARSRHHRRTRLCLHDLHRRTRLTLS